MHPTPRTLFFLCCIVCFSSFSQEQSAEEEILYDLIMEYRKDKVLGLIPLSKSLTKVAQLHSKDLALNRPDQGNCNAHSWSEKGKWTSCCYTSDHAKASCMWDKPKELSSYNHPGYEISCVGSNPLRAVAALKSWKTSKSHNDVMINLDVWDEPWLAIGIGLFQGYATVWFGHYPED